jgi:hypothetical protein
MSFRKTQLHPIVALAVWMSLSTLVLEGAAQSPDAPRFDSPRMAALARELMAGHRDALDDFWRQMKDNAPLVEPIPGSDAERWITFVWQGDEKTQRVTLLGDMPSTDVSQGPLRRLADTDLWYKLDFILCPAKLPRTLQARHEWRGLGSCLSPFPGMLKNPQPVFRAYAPAGVVTLPRNG